MHRKTLWLMIGLTALLCAFSLTASAEVSYMGMTFDESAEYIDLGNTVVRDFSELKAFLSQFPNLKKVDMYATEMYKDDCDRLADAFPEVEWGWLLVIPARDHSHYIRTDSTAFSTLHSNKSVHHTSEDFEILKYCHNLMALDVGHNEVRSLDFLYDLPNLRILIIACNYVEDITPIETLEKLEYAELFKNKIHDISPLQNLQHLMDLNLAFNGIEDWSPLWEMTSLKRLWVYQGGNYSGGKNMTKQQVNELKAALPDCYLDSTHYSTSGGWRGQTVKKNGKEVLIPHPHYKVLQEIFPPDQKTNPSLMYKPFEDSYPDDEEDY